MRHVVGNFHKIYVISCQMQSNFICNLSTKHIKDKTFRIIALSMIFVNSNVLLKCLESTPRENVSGNWNGGRLWFLVPHIWVVLARNLHSVKPRMFLWYITYQQSLKSRLTLSLSPPRHGLCSEYTWSIWSRFMTRAFGILCSSASTA